MELLFENMVDDKGAQFSDCGKYRYALWRIWDSSKPLVMCIGLNPSTATKDKPDPTITRVVDLTKSAGYGGFYMMNLFAFITPYPKELKKCGDPLAAFGMTKLKIGSTPLTKITNSRHSKNQSNDKRPERSRGERLPL